MIITRESNTKDWLWLEKLYYQYFQDWLDINQGKKITLDNSPYPYVAQRFISDIGIKLTDEGPGITLPYPGDFHIVNEDKFIMEKMQR